jgi:hypothetical protein
MANLFDPAQSMTTEPLTVVVGDFIQWRRIDLSSDYPNTAYTMTYVARINAGGNNEIVLTGTNYNSDYLFTVTSEDSANFVAGYYHWQLEAVQNSSGNRIVIDRGEFTAAPDLDVNNSDPRSHAEIMLDKIESLLQGKADSDVSSYSIAGRSLSKLSFDELMKARNDYRREVKREKNAELIRQGKATSATVQVRF